MIKHDYIFVHFDVGLISSLLGFNLYALQSLEEVVLINKGALAEQVVGQLLRLRFPHYRDPCINLSYRTGRTLAD